MTEKTCAKCLQSKPVEEFYAHATNRDRLFSICKPCHNAKTIAHREENREATLARRREHRKENVEHFREQDHADKAKLKEDPERLANKREKAKQWDQANIERRRESDRRKNERVKNDPARLANKREYSREWSKDHPEVGRRRAKARRAREHTAPVIDMVDLDLLFARDNGICSLCHKKVKREEASIDHIIPLSPIGPHSYQNTALAHRGCNSRKRDRVVTQQMRLF